MGQSSQTTNTSSSTSPWSTAMPTVNSLFGALNPLIGSSGLSSPEQTAINQLTANAQNGNPYAPAIGSTATNLLNGGGATSQNGALLDNLTGFKTGMSAYTDPNYSTINSPAVRAALDQVGTDAKDAINSQFAAAGRSGSGMNAQTVARGIAQAEAPIILAQANQDTATRQGALNSIYGAGNTTSGAITNNNQIANANELQGVSTAGEALNANNWGPQQTIAAQELAKSIPASNLGLLAQIGLPLASLGTNSSGTSTTTSNPSLFSMLTSGAQALGSGPSVAANGATSAGSGLLGLLGML